MDRPAKEQPPAEQLEDSRSGNFGDKNYMDMNGDLRRELGMEVGAKGVSYYGMALITGAASYATTCPEDRATAEGLTRFYTPLHTADPEAVTTNDEQGVWGTPPHLRRGHGTKEGNGKGISIRLIIFLILIAHTVLNLREDIPPKRRQRRGSNSCGVYVTLEMTGGGIKGMMTIVKLMHIVRYIIVALARYAPGRLGRVKLTRRAMKRIEGAKLRIVGRSRRKQCGAPMRRSTTAAVLAPPQRPECSSSSNWRRELGTAHMEQRENGIWESRDANGGESRPVFQRLTELLPRPLDSEQCSTQGHLTYGTSFKEAALIQTEIMLPVHRITGMVRRDITCTAMLEVSPYLARRTPVRWTRVAVRVKCRRLIFKIERHRYAEIMT